MSSPPPFDVERAGGSSLDASGRQILDAARSLFLEFGLRRTTMDDVARRAGVGRVTVYRHYADKNALFAAVVMRECARAVRDIERQLAAYRRVDELVVEWFARVVVTAQQHPLGRRLLETDPEWLVFQFSLNARPILELGTAYLTELVRQVQKRGVAAHLDPTIVAEATVRLIQSILLTPGGRLAPQDEADAREIARRHLLPLVHPPAIARSNAKPSDSKAKPSDSKAKPSDSKAKPSRARTTAPKKRVT